MAAPSTLNVKRKATDGAPEVLILEGSNKRLLTGIRYFRESKVSDAAGLQAKKHRGLLEPGRHVREQLRSNAPVWRHQPVRRCFHLEERPEKHGRGEVDDDDVATFVEKKRVRSGEHVETKELDEDELFGPLPPLKKPGKGAAVAKTNSHPQQPESESEQRRRKELEDWGAEAAREVVQREREIEFAEQVEAWTKPKNVAAPKLSGQRSRDIHRERVASNGSPKVDTFKDLSQELDVDDEADYVVERYVLAPSSDEAAVQAHALIDKGNVGYLVITEADESLWNSYLEEESSDEDEDSADADSNAEDFYAADYPEDELASDDEFDRAAYSYRGVVAEDDEEWNEDTGAFSDEEDGLEGMRKRFERLTAQALGTTPSKD